MEEDEDEDSIVSVDSLLLIIAVWELDEPTNFDDGGDDGDGDDDDDDDDADDGDDDDDDSIGVLLENKLFVVVKDVGEGALIWNSIKWNVERGRSWLLASRRGIMVPQP